MGHCDLHTATTLLLFLLLLLIYTTTAAVIDSNGNQVRPGQPYFISTIIFGGADVTALPRGDSECPLYAAQAPSPGVPGNPVKFTPSSDGPQLPFIKEGAPIKIEFTQPIPSCNNAQRGWGVGGDGYVVIGSSDIFTIQQVDGSDDNLYNIQYCNNGDCQNNVGLLFDDQNGSRYLSLHGEPLLVEFRDSQN